MYTNADITIYKKTAAGYDRHQITGADGTNGVFWSELAQSNILKSGSATVGTVNIMIPLANISIDIKTSDDLVIKGLIDFEIDNTSPQAVSSSMSQLRRQYTVFSVVTADKKDYGSPSMQHYQLSCK